MVLKLSIRTSASHQQQRSEWGLRVTQNEYFSLIAGHTMQLLLVPFCDTSAGIGATSFRTDAQTDGRRKDRQTWKSKYLSRYFKSNAMQFEQQIYS